MLVFAFREGKSSIYACENLDRPTIPTAPCFVRMIQDQNVCSDVSQTSEVFRYSSHLLWSGFILRLKPSIGIEDYK